MSKFATVKVDAINAKELVEQLVIDGKEVLNAYEDDLTDTTYQSEFKTMLTYIEYAANGNSLPLNKIKKVCWE